MCKKNYSILFILCLFLVGCFSPISSKKTSVGNDSGEVAELRGGNGGNNNGNNGGDSDAGNPPPAGSFHVANVLVNKINHLAGANGEMVIKAVMPVPNYLVKKTGKFTLDKSFSVVDRNGVALPTQLNIVSVYPSAGSDLYVEKVELVFKAKNYNPAGDMIFKVMQVNEAYNNIGFPIVSSDVESLITNDQSIFFETEDQYGKRYGVSAIKRDSHAGKLNEKITRKGVNEFEKTFHNVMRPFAGQTNTKSHLFGVKTFFTAQSDNIIQANFIIHNAHSGDVPSLNSPLHWIWFKDISVHLPRGWKMRPIFETIASPKDLPQVNSSHPLNGSLTTKFDLIKAMANGKMQMLKAGRQIVLKTLIYKSNASLSKIEGLVEREYLGFVRPGVAEDGRKLFYFDGDLATNYLPNTIVPQLHKYYNMNAVNNDLNAQFDNLRNAVKTGSSLVSERVFDNACGYFMGGSDGPQGGNTSGSFIDLYKGVQALAAASVKGFRYYELHKILINNRQTLHLFDLNGEPTQRETWLTQSNGQTYNKPADNGHRFCMDNNNSKGDVFGYCDAYNAQRVQINGSWTTLDYHYAESNNQIPSCYFDARMKSYNSIDEAHWVRALRSLAPAAAIMNDNIAKFNLEQYADNYRMVNSPFPTKYSAYQGKNIYDGLAGLRQFAINNPGQGREGSVRALGHTMDSMAIHYVNLMDSTKRSQFKELVDWMTGGIYYVLQPNIPAIGQNWSGGPFHRLTHHINHVVPHAQQVYESALFENGRFSVTRAFYNRDNLGQAGDKVIKSSQRLMNYYVFGTPRDKDNGQFFDMTTSFFNNTPLVTENDDIVADIEAVGDWNTKNSNKQYNGTHTSVYFLAGFKSTGNPKILCEAFKTYADGTAQGFKNSMINESIDKFTDKGGLFGLMEQLNWQVPGGCN